LFENEFSRSPHSAGAVNGRLNDGSAMSKNNKNTYELFEDWQLAQTSVPMPDRAAVAEVSADYPDQDLACGTETILFIDDEEIIVDVARDMLEILGYKVLVAQRGEEAVRIYEQHKDEIDLVIQDMVMPGMNGADVFKAIKLINPAVKVILASGYVMNKQIAAVMEAGCRAFMQKPFRIEDLSAKVREVLDAP
jgi:CheY-like chemotaxis protein